jgi:hypothetical protein
MSNHFRPSTAVPRRYECQAIHDVYIDRSDRVKLYSERDGLAQDIWTGRPLKGLDAEQWFKARFDRSEGDEGTVTLADLDRLDALCEALDGQDVQEFEQEVLVRVGPVRPRLAAAIASQAAGREPGRPPGRVEAVGAGGEA